MTEHEGKKSYVGRDKKTNCYERDFCRKNTSFGRRFVKRKSRFGNQEGTGIGYGIVEAFVRQGAKVILTGRNEDQLKQSCDQLKKGSSQYNVWNVAGYPVNPGEIRRCRPILWQN